MVGEGLEWRVRGRVGGVGICYVGMGSGDLVHKGWSLAWVRLKGLERVVGKGADAVMGEEEWDAR